MNKIEQFQNALSRALIFTNSINTHSRDDMLKKAISQINIANDLRIPRTAPILKRVYAELHSAQAASENAPGKYLRLDFSELKKAQHDATMLLMQEEPEEQVTESDIDFSSAVFQSGKEAPNVHIGNRPFGVFRVPLVAISTPSININLLRQFGIKADNVNDYPVLHSQLVVGVKHTPSTGRNRTTSLDSALEVQELLERTRRIKLELVSMQPYIYKNASYYWFAEQPVMRGLLRATNNHLNISQWGFAFN